MSNMSLALASVPFFCAAFSLVAMDTCPFRLHWFNIDNDLYGVSDESTSITTALACCSYQASNMRLTVLGSGVNTSRLLSFMTHKYAATTKEFWINARKEPTTGDFTWPDGSSLQPSLWETNEPSKGDDCTRIRKNSSGLYVVYGFSCSGGSFSVFCQGYNSHVSGWNASLRQCNYDLLWVSISGWMYGVSSIEIDYWTARNCCASFGPFFRLAILDDEINVTDTFIYLKQMYGHGGLWVDATRQEFAQNFTWSNGKSVNPDLWSTANNTLEPDYGNIAAVLDLNNQTSDPKLYGTSINSSSHLAFCQEWFPHAAATTTTSARSSTTSPTTTALLTTEPIIMENTSTTADITEKVLTSAITQEVSSIPITTEQVATLPITTKQVATLPITTKQVATLPITTKQEATLPITTGQEATLPIITGQEATLPITTGQDATLPITTGQDATLPITTKQEATLPITTGQEATLPITTKQEATQPITTGQEATLPITTKQDATLPITTKQEATLPITTKQEATLPITSNQVATLSITTKQVATLPITTKQEATLPITTGQEATLPITTRQEATLPITTKQVATLPITTKQEATLPITTGQEATLPITTRQEATLPITTKQVATLPITSNQVATLPITTKQEATLPITTKQEGLTSVSTMAAAKNFLTTEATASTSMETSSSRGMLMSNSPMDMKSLQGTFTLHQIISTPITNTTNQQPLSTPAAMLNVTTTRTTSSTLATVSSPQNLKLCTCQCKHNRQIPVTNMNEKVKQIKRDLTVSKQNLSRVLREKISAQDVRTSSHVIGGAGLLLLVILGAAVVCLDLCKLLHVLTR